MSMKIKQEPGLFDSARAPPRRRARGDDMDEQPVFLRKAFTMITSCPPEYGGWSVEGDAIVIKDLKGFADRVIPTAYRHNNLASFVRQLNFYGFRKVKPETTNKLNWWIFRHPHFLRGQPHLMSEIKRSVHYANEGEGCNVVELRGQVSSLSEKVIMLHEQVEQLTQMVSTLAVSQNPTAADAVSGSGGKKRKLNDSALAMKEDMWEPRSPPAFTRQQSLNSFDFDLLMDLDEKDTLAEAEAEAEAEATATENLMELPRESSEMIMEDMSSSSASAAATFINTNNSPAQLSSSTTSDQTTIATAMREFASLLSSLSPELKERFVDKLAEVVGTQLTQTLAPKDTPVVAHAIAPIAAAPVLQLPQSVAENSAVACAQDADYQALAPWASAAVTALFVANLRHIGAHTMPAVPSSEKFGPKTNNISITA